LATNRTMPACTVLPELVYDDVGEAVRWLGEAFGFATRWQADDHRAQLRAGDCAIVVRDDPGGHVGRRCMVLVRVRDIEDHLRSALAAGASLLKDLSDYPYGERQFSVEDPWGHRWTFTQSIADVAPEEWGGTTFDLS
jgi:uncharacterized glyoxalase superfamily protein PhnB